MKDIDKLELQTRVFEVNLMGAIRTSEFVLKEMISRNTGHFIGLSSISDKCPSKEAPSYSAAKSALSIYLEGLGLALEKTDVKITNIRFGFVDTKMAKSDFTPFIISKEKAASDIISIMNNPQLRFTRPHIMDFIMWFIKVFTHIRILFKKY